MARKKPLPPSDADAPTLPPAEASTEAPAASETPAADTEVDANAPLLTVAFDFHREFRKHAKTGELVAVELVNGALHGIRRCSKPEEQTAGALPVMALEDRESAVGQWYRAEALMFRPWEPAPLPRALMAKLSELYEESVEARNGFEAMKLRMKSAKTWVEDVDERIFQLLRRLHETPGQVELPLESEPALPLEPEPLDAAEDRAGDSSVETPEPGLDPADVREQLGESDDPPAWVMDPDNDATTRRDYLGIPRPQSPPAP